MLSTATYCSSLVQCMFYLSISYLYVSHQVPPLTLTLCRVLGLWCIIYHLARDAVLFRSALLCFAFISFPPYLNESLYNHRVTYQYIGIFLAPLSLVRRSLVHATTTKGIPYVTCAMAL